MFYTTKILFIIIIIFILNIRYLILYLHLLIHEYYIGLDESMLRHSKMYLSQEINE